MHFVKVGRHYLNLDQVAKVKKITRQGEDSLIVVFADESLESQRFTGRNMQYLELYLKAASQDLEEHAEIVRKLEREVTHEPV